MAVARFPRASKCTTKSVFLMYESLPLRPPIQRHSPNPETPSSLRRLFRKLQSVTQEISACAKPSTLGDGPQNYSPIGRTVHDELCEKTTERTDGQTKIFLALLPMRGRGGSTDKNRPDTMYVRRGAAPPSRPAPSPALRVKNKVMHKQGKAGIARSLAEGVITEITFTLA